MQTHCDLCGVNVTDEGFRDDWRNKIVDGRVRGLGWAWMCLGCHAERGVGLGTGRGQVFDVVTDRKLEG